MIRDTGRSSGVDTMGGRIRSVARVSLFRDRFWRSSKEQKDNAVKDDPFGERMSSEDISWRARYDKVVRYLASERAKEISCYETAPPRPP